MATKKVRGGWLARVVLSALALMTLWGCGVKRVPVAGTVTLDGKPLSDAVLTFSPDASRGNNAPISCTGPVKDGRYELQTAGTTRSASGSGVPPGWYKVTVRVTHLGNRKQPRIGQAARRRAGGTPDTRKQPKAETEVPEKYTNVEKTPLAIEVKDKPEPGAYDIKLEK
jgi:hypothetical protein